MGWAGPVGHWPRPFFQVVWLEEVPLELSQDPTPEQRLAAARALRVPLQDAGTLATYTALELLDFPLTIQHYHGIALQQAEPRTAVCIFLMNRVVFWAAPGADSLRRVLQSGRPGLAWIHAWGMAPQSATVPLTRAWPAARGQGPGGGGKT